MSDKYDESIQDIAVKHGIVLGRDDPILILQTMNERLIEETRQAQATMLVEFREEMEYISSQWKDDAKEKAEKILNVALMGSKEAMARVLQDSTNESVQTIKKMIADSLAEARDLMQQSQKFSRFALLSSIAVLTGSCLFIFIFLEQILR